MPLTQEEIVMKLVHSQQVTKHLPKNALKGYERIAQGSAQWCRRLDITPRRGNEHIAQGIARWSR